jgi:hypothetical protein
MKKTTLILLAFISALLMGCKEDKSPPKNAIKHSLELLNENKIAEFRSSLIGKASQQMASDRAVEALRQKISQIGQTEFGNESVTSSSQTPQGSSIVNYRVEVKASRGAVVGSVDVYCRTDYSTTSEYVCENDEPVYDGGGDYDRNEPNPPRYDDSNDSGHGHLTPGDSNPKTDPDENRDSNRPPRFPGMIGFSQLTPQLTTLSQAQPWTYQPMGRRCYNRENTTSSTKCKVSQINL